MARIAAEVTPKRYLLTDVSGFLMVLRQKPPHLSLGTYTQLVSPCHVASTRMALIGKPTKKVSRSLDNKIEFCTVSHENAIPSALPYCVSLP